MQFLNRTDAGRQLSARLTEYANRSDVIVLALPRGGVPVAFEVTARLSVPVYGELQNARGFSIRHARGDRP